MLLCEAPRPDVGSQRHRDWATCDDAFYAVSNKDSNMYRTSATRTMWFTSKARLKVNTHMVLDDIAC